MSLYIRQIVLVAHELEPVVDQLQQVLDVDICFQDPGVGEFGLENQLMVIGEASDAQFLEVVAPVRHNTAAGRHLDRHGESGYMLLLQTDYITRERARFNELGVRVIWQAFHPDITAMHLHPKDLGGAIVSIDQPTPAESWRWAGPRWQKHASNTGAQRVLTVHISARDPAATAQRWATVLGLDAPIPQGEQVHLDLEDGTVVFEPGDIEVITGFGLHMAGIAPALETARDLDLPVRGNTVTIGGVVFELTA